MAQVDQNDDTKIDQKNMCIICTTQEANTFNYPCLHSCYCSECVVALTREINNKCPNCSKGIWDFDPWTLKEGAPDEYFDKYEVPKLRAKPLDLNDKFDQIIFQRRNAFIHHRFDILDIGTVKLKLSDLANASHNEHIDLTDDETFGISILNSSEIKKTIESYHKRINTENFDKYSDDEYSDDDKFKSIKRGQYPSMNCVNKYPLKCKWIDVYNNIHFEYFQLFSVEHIVDFLLNTDITNHPLCNNWCVEYEYQYKYDEYQYKDDEDQDDDDDYYFESNLIYFDIKKKSFDYNLFWSCCLYFDLFKTCGVIDYDDYLKQMINQRNQSQNNITQQKNQIFYHNKKEDVLFKSSEKTHYISPSLYADDKYVWMAAQSWFYDHDEKEKKSKPLDRNDAFYVEMINRKKCMVLGNFKVIDRELMETQNRNKSNNDDNITNDDFNIFENDKIKKVSERFKQNNKLLSYRVGSESDGLHRFIKKDESVFDFADYSGAHRCIAIWIDDNGKQHEEWFKLYSHRSLYNPESDGKISSIYWHVCGRRANEYYDQNTFWAMATMFKVFGICGIKEIDEQYYDLRRVYKYLVSGYVNEMNKTKTLFSQIPVGISQIILKYHPFISGQLN